MAVVDFGNQPIPPGANVVGAIGGLSGITGTPAVSNPNAMPVYRVQTFAPGSEINLQEQYGTAAFPAFEWARRIQSGEAILQESWDETAAEKIAASSPEELAKEGISQDTRALIAQGIGALAQNVVAGAMVRAPGAEFGSGFGTALAEEARSYLPSGLGGLPPTVQSMLDIPSNTSMVTENFGSELVKAGYSPAGGSQIITPPGGTGQISYTPFKTADIAKAQLSGVRPTSAAQSTSVVGGGAGGYSPPSIVEASPGFFDKGGWLSQKTTGVTPSFSAVGLTFGIDLGFNLLSGMKPKKALINAAATTAGFTIGTMIAGPIGGFVGSSIAKIVTGGSVICTELHRQGEISDSVYRMTNYYISIHLTPTQIKGYYFWGVPVARRLKKGKGIKTWKFIYGRWANHVAYRLGSRKKFDLLGFIIAFVMEDIVSRGLGKLYECTLEKRRLGYANA
jgi:hypothetical protein